MDRNVEDGADDGEVLSRSLRGNVDRNQPVMNDKGVAVSRSLRGNVDRNIADNDISRQYVKSFPTWERG